MTRTAPKPLTAALAALTVFALTGCQGSTPGTTASTPPTGVTASTPATTSTPVKTTTPASSPATSTAPTDPNIPLAARANTAAGAVAFTDYFLKRLNASYAKPDPSYIAPLILSACKSCALAKSSVVYLVDHKQRLNGNIVTPTNIIISTFSPTTAKTYVSTMTPKHAVVNESGGVVQEVAAADNSLTISLTFSGQWRISELQGVG